MQGSRSGRRPGPWAVLRGVVRCRPAGPACPPPTDRGELSCHMSCHSILRNSSSSSSRKGSRGRNFRRRWRRWQRQTTNDRRPAVGLLRSAPIAALVLGTGWSSRARLRLIWLAARSDPRNRTRGHTPHATMKCTRTAHRTCNSCCGRRVAGAWCCPLGLARWQSSGIRRTCR